MNVFDTRAEVSFWRWQRILTRRGVLVSVNPVLRNPATRAVFRFVRRRIEARLVRPSGPDLAQLTAWIERGDLRSVVDRISRSRQPPMLTDAAKPNAPSETRHHTSRLANDISGWPGLLHRQNRRTICLRDRPDLNQAMPN